MLACYTLLKAIQALHIFESEIASRDKVFPCCLFYTSGLYHREMTYLPFWIDG
jgi:hypothetical protein